MLLFHVTFHNPGNSPILYPFAFSHTVTQFKKGLPIMPLTNLYPCWKDARDIGAQYLLNKCEFRL